MSQIYRDQLIGKVGVLKGITSALFLGESGAGKTHAAIALAKHWQAELLFFACYDGLTREDFLGEINSPALLKSLITNQMQPDLYKQGVLAAAFQLSTTKKVVVLLDELDKANPEVDGFLLSALQEGFVIVNGVEYKANTANIILVATVNDNRELLEPLYRRLQRVKFEFPTKEVLFNRVKAELHKSTIGRKAYQNYNISMLIDIVYWYRSMPEVAYRIKPDEVTRLLIDMTFCTKQEELWFTIKMAFSPYDNDHSILAAHPAGGRKYILGAITNHKR